MLAEDVLSIVAEYLENDASARRVLADMFEEKNMAEIAKKLRQPSYWVYYYFDSVDEILESFDDFYLATLADGDFDVDMFLNYLNDHLEFNCRTDYFTKSEYNAFVDGYAAGVDSSYEAESEIMVNVVGCKETIVEEVLATILDNYSMDPGVQNHIESELEAVREFLSERTINDR